MTNTKPEKAASAVSDEQLAALEAKADELYKAAAQRFENTYRQQNASKARWFDEVARAGTFSDRMSMVQLRVQQSPMFSLEQVERLVDSVPKKGHPMLRDLFRQEYLPSDRKLSSFSSRPLKEVVRLIDGNWKDERAKEAEERLIEWKYESDLKKCYTKFLTSVESNASSSLEGIAEAACATLLRLLIDKPEQESFLLRALVNKLGHPSRRVASRVAHHLGELVQAHANMRPVVVDEVAQLIFRKNISEKAQYYGVHFLSRLYLQAGEFGLAHKLIKLYLNLFKVVVAKCDHDHPMIPLLISGINRAVPYARSNLFEENGPLVTEMDKLYAFVHNSKFSIALNVLKLLFNIHSSNDGLPDRFYASFYRRLLSVQSNALNRQFFNFFLRAVKNDSVEVRVRAFLKRLFQIALKSPAPEFTVAALMLADIAVRERPNLLVFTKLADKDVSLPTMEIIKKEPKEETKPLINGHGLSHIVSACGDVDRTLRSNYTPAVHQSFDGDEEERYYDVQTESDEERKKLKVRLTPAKKKPTLDFHTLTPKKEKRRADSTKFLNGVVPRAKRLRVVEFGGMAAPAHGGQAPTRYHPLARNPLFANANLAVDVELLALARHYHPTVQIFAKKLIAGEPVKYDSDPLENFTAMSFIERFAIKNPKKKDNKEPRSELKAEDTDSIEDDIDIDNEAVDDFEGAEDVSDEEEIDDLSDMDDGDHDEDMSFNGDAEDDDAKGAELDDEEDDNDEEFDFDGGFQPGDDDEDDENGEILMSDDSEALFDEPTESPPSAAKQKQKVKLAVERKRKARPFVQRSHGKKPRRKH